MEPEEGGAFTKMQSALVLVEGPLRRPEEVQLFPVSEC
jgi:hypothetical protein